MNLKLGFKFELALVSKLELVNLKLLDYDCNLVCKFELVLLDFDVCNLKSNFEVGLLCLYIL